MHASGETRPSKLWLIAAVPIGLVLAASGEGPRRPARLEPAAVAEAAALTARIDAAVEVTWRREGLAPAPEVDDLLLARRLWVDLLGTIPSFEELRELEALPGAPGSAERREALIDRALGDPRLPFTLGEQLARIVVGPGAKPDDLIYRRRRLVDWLAAQVSRGRTWDALCRELLTAEGLSTDTPAVNFVLSQDKDPIKLAARTARAFLGVRIDCAQCHDHPFADWKQSDFEGLAAYFARVDKDNAFVQERREGELDLDAVTARGDVTALDSAQAMTPPASPSSTTGASMTMSGVPAGKRRVAPAVPYEPSLVAATGPRGKPATRREALAAWVTSPRNPYFARAIANRMWAWLIGRGIVEPEDELDTGQPWSPALLDVLAGDLAANGFDLRRTIRAIVASRAYRTSSAAPDGVDEAAAERVAALAPVRPLRTSTLGAALYQATSLWTWSPRRALLLRFLRSVQTSEFEQRVGGGDDGEDEDEETLLERLHLMNGKLVTERTQDDDLFGPTVRLPQLTPTDEAAVDAAFLMALTRRPTPAEAGPWLARLAAGSLEKDPTRARTAVMADLGWALLNCTEFSTKH